MQVAEPVARSNFYPCRHQAGHHIPHTRKALGPHPCYQRAPIFADGRSQATRSHLGRVDLQYSRCIILRDGNNMLCLPADGF